jgi:predicted nucleic acid-binding protein
LPTCSTCRCGAPTRSSRSAHLGLRENFSPHEATYIALAEVVAEAGAPLVTADGRLARAAAEHTAVDVILAT